MAVATCAAAQGSALFACQDVDGDGFYHEANCGTLQDCNDASAATYPGAPEICDGYDNDCDSELDNDPVCDTSCDLAEPGETLSSTNIGSSVDAGPPTLVWTGSEYGVTWRQNRNIYFGRLDAWGHKVGSDLQLTNNRAAGAPSLVWNGSAYGVAWSDGRDGQAEIYFARIDATGHRIGSDNRVTDTQYSSSVPSLVWTGREYGVSWSEYEAGDGNAKIYFARIDAAGTKIGPDLRVMDDPWEARGPSMVWTGSEYGVAWWGAPEGGVSGNFEIYFARIDASGDEIGADVRVTDWPQASIEPSLVWSGSGYAVAWSDFRDGNHEIYFARLDTAGQRIGSDVRVTDWPQASTGASLFWTGSEYAVIWQDDRLPVRQIYFARIGAVGNKIGPDLQNTDAEQHALSPRAVWTGSHYAVAWITNSGGYSILETARLGCNCSVDADFDLVSVCHDCDDSDPRVFPGAWETCDGVNNDCRDPSWPVPPDHADEDLDGRTPCDGDCDDSRDDVFPGAAQLCDSINNDCDDPDWPAVPQSELDGDGDSISECEGDCDDSTSSTRPGAPENCNGIDDNCDWIVDNIGGADTDRDGASDACDNCPVDRNPSQVDRDVDGVGDRCDLDDGLIYILFHQPAYVEWQQESGFATWNSYRGDLAVLHRDGVLAYTQDPARVPLADRNCDVATPSVADDDPPPGAAVFFLTTGNFTGTGIESSLGVDSFGAERPNRFPCP